MKTGRAPWLPSHHRLSVGFVAQRNLEASLGVHRLGPRLLEHCHELVELDGLLEVAEGVELTRLFGRLQVSVAGQNDDLDLRSNLLDAL